MNAGAVYLALAVAWVLVALAGRAVTWRKRYWTRRLARTVAEGARLDAELAALDRDEPW